MLFDDLFGQAAAAAIALTGTCAVLRSLEPERIRVAAEGERLRFQSLTGAELARKARREALQRTLPG